MSSSYIYYAQYRHRPADPMYALVCYDLDALKLTLEHAERHYIVFRFDLDDGSCKVVSGVQDT